MKNAKRRIVQILFLLGLHSSWGPQAKWFCNPVLSCHSCPLAWFACPIGIFVHYSSWRLFPFFAIGTVLLIAVSMGRLFCGWVCPFGTLQDGLYKIPAKKFNVPEWTSSIKYFVLLIMVFLLPFFLGELTMFSFCRICPAATLQVSLPSLIKSGFSDMSGAMMVRFIILLGVMVLAVMSSRSFCKVFCPIGALLALSNYVSFWKVRMPKDSCISCGACDKVCPTNVKPSERAKKNIPVNRKADCIVCHDCKNVCPMMK